MILCHVMNICKFLVDIIILRSSSYLLRSNFFCFDKERQSIQPKQTPRRWLPAVKCNGVMYGIGGNSGRDNSTTLKTLEKYDFVKINRNMLINQKLIKN